MKAIGDCAFYGCLHSYPLTFRGTAAALGAALYNYGVAAANYDQ